MILPFSCRSRLVGCGRCATKQQLEEIRQAYGVSTANCMIDSGFKASEIYRFCAATGWTPPCKIARDYLKQVTAEKRVK